MSTATMTDVMTLIQEEAEHLREFCAALAPEAWGTPSACAGWAVGDVLAHLAQGAQNWSASLGRAQPVSSHSGLVSVALR